MKLKNDIKNQLEPTQINHQTCNPSYEIGINSCKTNQNKSQSLILNQLSIE